ncbi:MAG: AMP-binding protein [Pseudomonadota bacterium]
MSTLPLIQDYDAEAPLFWRGTQALTQGRWLGAVMALAERLPEAAYYLPLLEDRAAFSLLLGASLVRGKPCLLPASNGADHLAKLRDTYPQALTVSELPDAGFDAPRWTGAVPEIPAQQTAVIIHTSGSTGMPQAHSKSWAALRATAPLIRDRFGSGVNIVATVPSQHMYGLETTVMMALAASCPAHSGRPFFPADVAAALQDLPAPRAWVTTPVHLRACLASAATLPPLAHIVSATAPLSRELALQAEARFQTPVHEIYGCTEAASLATRRTTLEEYWTLYPGLSLSQKNDETFLRAPYLDEPVRLTDLIEPMPQGRFHLRGRLEDQFKVAGRRISLSELTQVLLAIPGVVDGVVFAPEDGIAARPAALAVAPGLDEEAIRAAMAKKLDAVFVPRPVRCVQSLPRNAVGKLPREALRELLRG